MNDLLLWMSARHSGSIGSFRSKITELGLNHGRSNSHIIQWNLEKLGHAEFAKAPSGTGWRIAPSILAASDPKRSPSGFLCGARTPALLDRLRSADIQACRQIQSDGPDTIEFKAPSALALQDFAARAGIEVQWNAPRAILACCPPPKEQLLAPAELPIGGWEVSRFSKSGLAWVPSSMGRVQSAVAGLFRFRSKYETKHVLIESGSPFSVEPAMGKFRILTKRHCPLSYAISRGALQIRASCRPPTLVERALILCSGTLPVFENGLLTYTRIEPAIAASVASLLGQRLK